MREIRDGKSAGNLGNLGHPLGNLGHPPNPPTGKSGKSGTPTESAGGNPGLGKAELQSWDTHQSWGKAGGESWDTHRFLHPKSVGGKSGTPIEFSESWQSWMAKLGESWDTHQRGESWDTHRILHPKSEICDIRYTHRCQPPGGEIHRCLGTPLSWDTHVLRPDLRHDFHPPPPAATAAKSLELAIFTGGEYRRISPCPSRDEARCGAKEWPAPTHENGKPGRLGGGSLDLTGEGG